MKTTKVFYHGNLNLWKKNKSTHHLMADIVC